MKPFLSQGGGYRKLRVFRVAEIICDLTVYFVKTRIPAYSRTRDQMEQAARSGKQNIAEGSSASTTSRETEIKLTNVAKASFEELLLDYEDYLRQHQLNQWDSTHPRTARLKAYARSDRFMASPMECVQRMCDEEFCNLLITLINQATYMLRKMIETQQEQFLKHGGVREQMSRARRATFEQNKPK